MKRIFLLLIAILLLFSVDVYAERESFTKLRDTPQTYKDQAEKCVTVKADESGLEFSVCGAGGGLDTTGTVNADEIAVFSDEDTLKALNEAEFKTAYSLAPSTSHYLTDQAESGLSAEVVVTTIGKNLATSTNPGAITFGRANADNTFDWLSAADFRTAIGLAIGSDVLAPDGDGASLTNVMHDLADDTSPELGADLGMNGYIFTGILGNTPQSKTYDDNDDDDETIGTDLTSSLILITGDDDTDDDSIDLQDGTDAGQTITFVAYANVDSNDTFTIDVSTDSTCVNCTSIELTENGQFAQFEWNGSSWLKKWPITAIDIYADASITADDAYSAIEPLTTGINAGGSITVGQIVYYDTSASEWLLADADADGPPIEWPAWGVAVTAAGDGEAITVMTKGYYVDTGLSLTPRGLVYLSTTAGGFTQTAPSTAGDCVQVIGVAITATKILFSIDPTIYQTATGS